LFGDLAKRPVTAVFDQTQGSSDGGAIFLEASNRRYGDGLIEGLTGCCQDRRQAGKVEHTMDEILKQRIYGLACGYEDANDAARLSKDPIHKMLLDRDPVTGPDLASQSTLSRFENAVGRRTLYRMGMGLAEAVTERHKKRLGGHARLVTRLTDGLGRGGPGLRSSEVKEKPEFSSRWSISAKSCPHWQAFCDGTSVHSGGRAAATVAKGGPGQSVEIRLWIEFRPPEQISAVGAGNAGVASAGIASKMMKAIAIMNRKPAAPVLR